MDGERQRHVLVAEHGGGEQAVTVTEAHGTDWPVRIGVTSGDTTSWAWLTADEARLLELWLGDIISGTR